MDLGILVLRATLGLILAAHGSRKLFGWFGGPGLAAAGQGFEGLGFFPGRRHAALAGSAEVGAGLLLTLGLLTPVAAAVIVSVMLVAAAAVHVRNGFFASVGGFEYNLLIGVAALTLAFTGPGAFSIDAWFGYSVEGVWWGAGAAFAGIVGAALQLAQRRTSPEPGVAAAA